MVRQCGMIALLTFGCADLETMEATLVSNPLTDLEEVDPTPISGIAVEIVPAGSYTYLQLRRCDGELHWVVGLDKGLSEQDPLSFVPVGIARDFHSGRTGRTWSELIFGVVRPNAEACVD